MKLGRKSGGGEGEGIEEKGIEDGLDRNALNACTNIE